MKDALKRLTYEIELGAGEKLELPPGLVGAVGPGRWLVTVALIDESAGVRGHDAFLASYATEDEGLYDDLAGR